MKQAFFIISSITMALVALAFAYVFRSHTISSQQMRISANTNKIHIVTSFYPLGEFARQVGGDLVDVSVIVPAGVEPHEYEPTPQDIASIYAADIFIANGAGIDTWATKIQSDVEIKGVKVIVMSRVLGFDADVDDPHFWLDPLLVQQQIVGIQKALMEVDVKNQERYTQNTEMYIQKLRDLDQSYRDDLRICDNKMIMTSHNAFGYIAKRYQFETLSITGLSPESEPSTRQLADLATLARQKNMHYIFFETLVSPRLAQTLANEIGAQTLVFNPLEGLTDEEVAEGKNYIIVMEENLNNLQLAMNCHGK